MDLQTKLGLDYLPKLGKLAAKHDMRTLMFSDYFTLPVAPESVKWSSKVTDLGMMRNDSIGDCTIAGVGHLIQTWTANNGNQIILDDNDIVNVYSILSGYNPQTGQNDTGLNELDVLNYWRNTGIAGHKIDAYVKVSSTYIDHVKCAINIFGGMYLGIGLPISAQGQSEWDVPSEGTNGNGAAWSWGGHCVIAVDYDDKFVTVITWGTLLKMTWEFFTTYVDESYAILAQDFLTKNETPIGFDIVSLQTDLKYI